MVAPKREVADARLLELRGRSEVKNQELDYTRHLQNDRSHGSLATPYTGWLGVSSKST